MPPVRRNRIVSRSAGSWAIGVLMFSEKVRAKCSGGNVTQTAVAADRPGNQDGFRGGALCAVWGMGSSVLPTALEAVAVAVHFQDMHVVGETVQQRVGEPFRTEHVGPPPRTVDTTIFEMWLGSLSTHRGLSIPAL